MNSKATAWKEAITVVTGLPRSGTSMMMQMLAEGGVPPWTDAVRDADADNPRGYYEYEKVKSLARDNSWLAEAKGHAIKIVAPLIPKLPSDGYRVIFMERDMDEVLRSQTAMLDRSGKAGARLSPEQLGSVFRKHLQGAMELIQSEGYPVLQVAYRNCIEHPHSVASEVNEFLGGGLDDSSMATVVDKSLYRQRR